jgi:hypothetical protein
MESASTRFLGCCVGNGRNDADAASVNIQLNLRRQSNKRCQQFRSFSQVLAVMLHEITHTSIRLEDIHPPAFWELLEEIKSEYRQKLASGEVAKETDDYGCQQTFVNEAGDVSTVQNAANQYWGIGAGDDNANDFSLAEGKECGVRKGRRRPRRYGRGTKRSRSAAIKTAGIKATQPQQEHEKRRPLLKGAKMIDKRTKAGKEAMATQRNLTPRELAARAALQRFGGKIDEEHGKSTAKKNSDGDDSLRNDDDDDDDDESEEELIDDHKLGCTCRCCEWDNMLFVPQRQNPSNEFRGAVQSSTPLHQEQQQSKPPSPHLQIEPSGHTTSLESQHNGKTCRIDA